MEDYKLEDDGFPPVECLVDFFREGKWDFTVAPALISGVLRQGHKMLLAGPSKAGKSFALIELALCLASGKPWLGRFECTAGKVMYVNLEVDRASCIHRFIDVNKALFPEEVESPSYLHNITVWNLRGHPINWPRFVDILCRRAKHKNFAAIILDPFYKLNAGNETSAFDMVQFCNGLDRIAKESNASIIYCHHHSKGEQGWKNSMDRASGSGVFAVTLTRCLTLSSWSYRQNVGRQA